MNWNEDELSRFASSIEEMTTSSRREIWNNVKTSLLALPSPLPFNAKIYNQLSRYFSGNHAWECLRFRWMVEQGKIDAVKNKLDSISKSRRVKILLYLSKVCFESNILQLALDFVQLAYSLDRDNTQVMRRLIAIHHRLGNINQRVLFIEKLKAQGGRLYNNELECARDEKLLQEQVWQWKCTLAPIAQGNSIIHVLNKSYPEINGYTVRSMDIMRHQLDSGFQVISITKLGWPLSDEYSDWIQAKYENIDHYHLYDKNHMQLNKVPMSEYFQVYADRFADLLQRLHPKLIHTASNFQNALPPLTVAKKLGIPSIYEVRGLWHYTQSSKTKGFEASERFRLHERYELICCELADRVVVICDSLKSHLIELGVSPTKIHVIYNGVNIVEFQPQPPCPEMIKAYDLEEKLVIGFIGSVMKYEGLDILLHALVLLKNKHLKTKLLIIGDGPALSDLQTLSHSLGLDDVVTFVGKVPRKEVIRFYSVMDLLPFPRTRDKVCELITPLKPYEAMAMGKTVLVSDIPALREMVIEGETGLVFQPEDAESLAECIIQVRLFPELGRKARQWVVENRNWKKLVEKYREVYSYG